MEQNKVRNKIRSNYNLSEDGKKFIIHLIRNFLPLSEKAIYVTALPESNKPLKCCITGRVLQLRNRDTEKVHDDKGKRISNELTNGKNNNCPPVEPQPLQEVHVAMMANGSNRLLCLEAAEQLAIFLSEEIINGNKHLKWVESDMQRKQQKPVAPATPNKRMENAKLFSKPKEKAPEKDIRDILRERKTEKTLLGDLSALQKLKEQFEEKEKESAPVSEK